MPVDPVSPVSSLSAASTQSLPLQNPPSTMDAEAIKNQNRQLIEAANLGDFDTVRKIFDLLDPVGSAGPPVVPITHPGFAVKDESGYNILHISCRAGRIDLVRFLLTIATQDVRNDRNHAGSTPLHAAVSGRNPLVVELLLDSGVNLEIKDHVGSTALRRALDSNDYPISRTLLKRGAKTDEVPINRTFDVLVACAGPQEGPVLLLQSELTNGTHLSKVSLDATRIKDIDDPVWDSPSICFAEARLENTLPAPNAEFVNPSYYLEIPVGWHLDDAINWNWKVMGSRLSNNLATGIPTAVEVVHTGGRDVLLFPYFCLAFPAQVPDDSNATQSAIARDPEAFQTIDTNVDISWVMRKERGTKMGLALRLRSISYRCSFPPQYLAIPADGAECVIVFITEIRLRWKALVQGALRHLSMVRALQLKDAGNNSAVIKCLLADSQQWQTLRDRSIDHVVALEGVVDTFRTSPILHAEMMPPPDRVNPNRETVPTAKLARLAELVAVLKDECAQGLLKLDSQTRDMIELEFNLVSIYEARRSIDMSASMKRLSWITFIFLPLMFVSGLFGMNVDLLSDNPGWQWYLVVAIPFMALVVGIWVLCKYLYLPVLNFFERRRYPRRTAERGQYAMV